MGQIASFMEYLHLTYEEVLHEIPYRNLLIMKKDKQRPCYGDKMVEVDDETFFGKGAFRTQ